VLINLSFLSNTIAIPACYDNSSFLDNLIYCLENNYNWCQQNISSKVPGILKNKKFYIVVLVSGVLLFLPYVASASSLEKIKTISTSELTNYSTERVGSVIKTSNHELFNSIRKTQHPRKLGLSDLQKIKIFLLGKTSLPLLKNTKFVQEKIKIDLQRFSSKTVVLSLKNHNVFCPLLKQKYNSHGILSSVLGGLLILRAGQINTKARNISVRRNFYKYKLLKYFFILSCIFFTMYVLIDRTFKIKELRHSLHFYLLLADLYKKAMEKLVTFETISDYDTLSKHLKRIVWNLNNIESFKQKYEIDLGIIEINSEIN
jgi:hypothetical protein